MPKILAFSSSRSFVHNFYETRLSLKILYDEVPYKLSYFDFSHFAYYCTRKKVAETVKRPIAALFFPTLYLPIQDLHDLTQSISVDSFVQKAYSLGTTTT